MFRPNCFFSMVLLTLYSIHPGYAQTHSRSKFDQILLKDGRIIECQIVSKNLHTIIVKFDDLNLKWEFGNEIPLKLVKEIQSNRADSRTDNADFNNNKWETPQFIINSKEKQRKFKKI